MPWVYILRGASGRHYIGSTTDLERRLEQHRKGHTYPTRRLGDPLECVAALELGGLPEARAFERELMARRPWPVQFRRSYERFTSGPLPEEDAESLVLTLPRDAVQV